MCFAGINMNIWLKYVLLVSSFISLELNTAGQLPVTIPWSASLNINFGDGSILPAPLSPGQTDFIYTQGSPAPGQYGYTLNASDAGHLYSGPFLKNPAIKGYSMVASYNSSAPPQHLFKDTISSLCGGKRYLFWAGIRNLLPGSSCAAFPRFTFSIETVTGAVIDTFDTGIIGGSLSADNYAWYPGYYDRTKRPSFPFYGKEFDLPSGVTAVVLKIKTIPVPGSGCVNLVELDNILLSTIGPNIKISTQGNPDGWITGACFRGNVPAQLTSSIDTGHLGFGTPDYILSAYNSPAYQWQQSLDDGYTWTDIAGAASSNLSHVFNNPDTFWVRLRVSEAADISNTKCSNYSNLVQVQVDSFQKDVSVTSNSPVCTDGDLKFTLAGGASYLTTGPNGFYDNSPHPHIYHPHFADSGWYHIQVKSFGGCRTDDSAYVKIVGVNLSLSSDKTICYGEKVKLKAVGGTSYEWSPPEGLSNSKVAEPIASPVTTTTYLVKASNNTGCSAYDSVTIRLRNSLLQASIIGPEVSCPGDVIQFIDTSAGYIVNRLWDFGNGNTSIYKVPPPQTYLIRNGSVYSVQLSVTDTSGCVSKTTHYLKSVNNCYIAMPSAFTPNNDGLNDYFYPLNAYKARELEFKVFNRLGTLIFESKNWTTKWDGSYKGEQLPTSTFIWILTYTDEYNKRISKRGTVILIR